MGRKSDLEQNIRACYGIITEYETIQRDTDRPEERKRASRIIQEQWDLIEGYLSEYLPLCQRLDIPSPDDIREIAARFDSLKTRAQDIVPDSQSATEDVISPAETPDIHLPTRTYRELVGRDALIEEITSALRDPAGRWIVAIDGMGGIGKTALAREIAARCMDEGLFDALVWEQASREEIVVLRHREGIGSLTYETVLDSIGRQLGASDIPRLRVNEKEARVQALLQEQRVLVVLDNLETAKESQNDIAGRLRSLLHPSKALMTSRHRFEGDIYAINLTGLDTNSALRFIRQEAKEKNIDQVSSAETRELMQIALSTEGSPLAMKLVVGQLSHLPLDTVIDELREVPSAEERDNSDDYVRFYKFIFTPSWQLLSDDARTLLISMAHFASGFGGTFDAVKATSGLDGHVLARSIDELWRLSFLEVDESSTLKQPRYYLHALTQYFVLSDIVKVL